MKKLFFLITLYSLLGTSASAQWWVSGGNLIWPHGNVSITKGNLSVSNSFTAGDTLTMGSVFLLNGYTFDMYNLDLWKLFSIDEGAKISLGDLGGDNNGSKIIIDDNNVTITAQSYIHNINSEIVQIGDYTNGNSGTEIDLDDENRRIILDADSVKITNLPSDSTGLSPGQVYFDSNGFLKRKF